MSDIAEERLKDEAPIECAGPWSRRRGHLHETPLTVSWVDEKGSVVRLISTAPQTPPPAAAAPPPT